jgi:hypothetical protein
VKEWLFRCWSLLWFIYGNYFYEQIVWVDSNFRWKIMLRFLFSAGLEFFLWVPWSRSWLIWIFGLMRFQVINNVLITFLNFFLLEFISLNLFNILVNSPIDSLSPFCPDVNTSSGGGLRVPIHHVRLHCEEIVQFMTKALSFCFLLDFQLPLKNLFRSIHIFSRDSNLKVSLQVRWRF